MTKAQFLDMNVDIEFVKGGFIINYPTVKNGEIEYNREIVVSPRKLLQKIKEVLADTADDAETDIE